MARHGGSGREGAEAGPRSVIHAVVSESEGWYVAECLEAAVVTQGRSLDETLANLRSALEQHFDDEEPGTAMAGSVPV